MRLCDSIFELFFRFSLSLIADFALKFQGAKNLPMLLCRWQDLDGQFEPHSPLLLPSMTYGVVLRLPL
jgi:hypothetical protein